MNIETVLSIAKARKKIFKIAKVVQTPNSCYILTEKGKPKIAMISAKELESLQETLEITHIFPNLEKDIKKAEKEYKSGNYLTLEDILSKEGFVLKSKQDKNKHVSRSLIKKRRERSK